jgi:uncharacterized protein YkwD
MISKSRSLAILFLIFCLSFTMVLHAQKAGTNSDITPDILKYVNKHRTDMGLKPLINNAIIAAAAEQHSKNMATKKISFGHDGFNERMDKLAKQLPPSYSYAENVAEGATTAKEVVDQWLHSPGHKKNIEGDYNVTGIGIAKGTDGTLFYTQIFLNRSK